MKKIHTFIAAGLLFAASSCSVSAGLIVTDNDVNVKRGEASYSVVLGIFRPTNADISIQKAAKAGGITKIGTVDIKVKSGFFKTTYTTVVTGS